MRELRDKIVLVTGAGRGLGREIALAFARAGSRPIAADIDLAAAELTAAAVRELGAAGHAVRMDVTSDEEVLAARERIAAECGALDVLINNAGTAFGGPFPDVAWQRHRVTLEVNLAGPMRVTHAFLPGMLARPEAHVVNIASAAAWIALPRGASYAASKWGVLGFTESLREELRLARARHVAVTAVCPSFLSTTLFTGVRSPWLTPRLTPEYVARRIVGTVRKGREELTLPWTARLIRPLRGALPLWAVRKLYDWFGLSHSMDGWQDPAPSARESDSCKVRESIEPPRRAGGASDGRGA